MSEQRAKRSVGLKVALAIAVAVAAFLLLREKTDPTAPTRTPAPAPVEYLAWTANADPGADGADHAALPTDAYTTYRLRVRMDGGMEPAGEVRGIVFAVGESVYEARIEDRSIRQCECEKWMGMGDDWYDKPCPSYTNDGKEQVLSLVPLGGVAPLVLVPPTPERKEGEPVPEDQDVEVNLDSAVHPVATLGPYFLYIDGGWSYACGAAHGTHASSEVVYDVAKGAPVRWEDWPDLAAKTDPLRAGAFAALGEDIFTENPEGLTVTAVYPKFTGGRGLAANYQFTAEACYACSDDWAAYSRSTIVESDQIPEAWKDVAEIPAEVNAWLVGKGIETMRGWSRVPEGARAAVEARFAAR